MQKEGNLLFKYKAIKYSWYQVIDDLKIHQQTVLYNISTRYSKTQAEQVIYQHRGEMGMRASAGRRSLTRMNDSVCVFAVHLQIRCPQATCVHVELSL